MMSDLIILGIFVNAFSGGYSLSTFVTSKKVMFLFFWFINVSACMWFWVLLVQLKENANA